MIKNLGSLAVILIMAYLSWSYLSRPDEVIDTEAGITVVSGGAGGGMEGDDPSGEFLALLDKIKNIDFQNTIFTDETFRLSLEDMGKPLPSVLVERVNPFAPVEPQIAGTVWSNQLLGIAPEPATTTLPQATSTVR